MNKIPKLKDIISEKDPMVHGKFEDAFFILYPIGYDSAQEKYFGYIHPKDGGDPETGTFYASQLEDCREKEFKPKRLSELKEELDA